MQASKRIAKNSGILYIKMGITMFISLYTTRLVLGTLGAKDFGIFNIVAGSISMLTFLNSAMAAATQRFMSYAQGAGQFDKLKSIFNVSILLHLCIAIIVFLLLEGVGYFLFHGILKIPEARIGAASLIFQFSIVSTLFTIISVPYDAVINAHENMLLYAIMGVIESVSKLAIAFYVMHTNFDKLITYGLLMASLSMLLLIINRIYCHNSYPECKINFRKYLSRNLFKEMSIFGGWSFLGSMAGMLSNYGQGIVLNIFFGTVVNAAQGVASQISGQLSAFSGIMVKALNPVIVKSEGSNNRSLMLRSALTGSKFCYLLLAFFAVPFIIYMPNILNLWLKAVPEYAVIFCRLLLIKTLIEQLFIPLSSTISAVGKIRMYQITISLLAILPLIVSYVLFKFGYPPYVLYIVFIIQSLIRSFGIVLYFVKKHTGMSITLFLRNVVIRCFFVTLLLFFSGICVVYNTENKLFTLLLLFISNALLFPFAVYWIGLINEEREQFRNIIMYAFNRVRVTIIKT